MTRNHFVIVCGLGIVSAVHADAAEPSWKTKSITQWSEEDANQVLTSSPWARQVYAAILPTLSPQERRDGGATGGGDAVIPPAVEEFLGREKRDKRLSAGSSKSKNVRLVAIRWESALPVRAAELKAREIGAPAWEGDGDYVVAVYDVPLLTGRRQKVILQGLKDSARLKLEGRSDWKPSGVELLPRSNGLMIVLYHFSRTHEVTLRDERIVFEAQIERLVVGLAFEVREMRFQGKLEL